MHGNVWTGLKLRKFGTRVAVAAALAGTGTPAYALFDGMHLTVDSVQAGEPDFTFEIPFGREPDFFNYSLIAYDNLPSTVYRSGSILSFYGPSYDNGGGISIFDLETYEDLEFVGEPFLRNRWLDPTHVNVYFQFGTHLYTNQMTGNQAYVTLASLAGGAVPEPASWALMIAGFGLAGSKLRRQRTMRLRN